MSSFPRQHLILTDRGGGVISVLLADTLLAVLDEASGPTGVVRVMRNWDGLARSQVGTKPSVLPAPHKGAYTQIFSPEVSDETATLADTLIVAHERPSSATLSFPARDNKCVFFRLLSFGAVP